MERTLPVDPSRPVVVILCLAAAAGCEGERARPTPVAPSAAASADARTGMFVDVTEALGIAFELDRSVAGDFFMPDSMVTGCALFDYDNDGDLDIYLVNAFRDTSGRTETDEGANRLFRQDEDGLFTDVSARSGADDRGYGTGVAAADYDNDGDVDLYVANFGRDRLYRNNGDGTFSDVSDASGISNTLWSASVGFFDYDADGFLDIYVTNYLDYPPGAHGADAGGRPDYSSPSNFSGVPDVLYRNNGDGTFTDVSAQTGIGARSGKGLGVVFLDLNDDERIDIYVANDGERNFAWINEGETFSERALGMGLAINGFGRPEASMGIACGDCDGDGFPELFLTHLVQETNTLYRRVSPGQFEDATMPAGLGAVSVDVTGFGNAFLDVELDGDLDLVSVNGRVTRRPPIPGTHLNPHWTPYAEPNQLFLNDGHGRFTSAGDEGGDLCLDIEVSRGLAVGDLDEDGDLDLVVSNGNGTIKVYRNDAPRAGNWLMVRALDPDLRRDALGAVVRIHVGERILRRDIQPTQSYLSGNDPRAHFGLGTHESVTMIDVVWPDSTREHFPGVDANQSIELVKGTGRTPSDDDES